MGKSGIFDFDALVDVEALAPDPDVSRTTVQLLPAESQAPTADAGVSGELTSDTADDSSSLGFSIPYTSDDEAVPEYVYETLPSIETSSVRPTSYNALPEFVNPRNVLVGAMSVFVNREFTPAFVGPKLHFGEDFSVTPYDNSTLRTSTPRENISGNHERHSGYQACVCGFQSEGRFSRYSENFSQRQFCVELL